MKIAGGGQNVRLPRRILVVNRISRWTFPEHAQVLAVERSGGFHSALLYEESVFSRKKLPRTKIVQSFDLVKGKLLGVSDLFWHELVDGAGAR
jgi:hypothetical protein